MHTRVRRGLLALIGALALWSFASGLINHRGLEPVVSGLIVLGGLVVLSIAILVVGFVLAVPAIDALLAHLLGRHTRRGRLLDPEHLALVPARLRARLKRKLQLCISHSRPRPTEANQIKRIIPTEVKTPASEAFRTGIRPAGLYDGTTPTLSVAELDLAVERALRREVDLLGSGPIDLGRPINWHRDYVSGIEWRVVHHLRVNPVNLSRNADCKFPWEVARCQHWAHLACARGNRTQAIQEMTSQFKEFVQANAPGFGINYANAMEVAIRSVNWLCSFRACAAELRDHDIEHLLVEMAAAGEFVWNHLEYTGRGLNSNHYIADLLGLYVIGTLLPALPQAPEWRRFAGDELTTELTHQFDHEGVHREGSPYYARLVLELYLFAYVLGQRTADRRVDCWRERLNRAFTFIAAVIYPDGTLPRFGDDDAGRLLVPPGEEIMDVRYLLQIGAVLFDRGDLKARAGESPRPGLEFWLGSSGVQRYSRLTPQSGLPTQRIFESAGVAVTRDEGIVLVVQGGRRELRAPRGHLHNDLTSLEYFADGTRWVLDPGTYQYTRQPLWRNRFRATSSHSVIQVDDREQNMLRPDWLFYLCRDVEPKPLTREGDWLLTGYRSLRNVLPKEISRRIRISASGRVVQVRDRILECGEHRLTLGLNLAYIPFTFLERHLLHFQGPEGQLLVYFGLPDGFSLGLKDSWFSPRFGVRERCLRLEAVGTAPLICELEWGLVAIPRDQDVAHWMDKTGLGLTGHHVGSVRSETIDA